MEKININKLYIYILNKSFLGAMTPFTEDYMVLKYRILRGEIEWHKQ
jgi:hypothetical protein